jgi:hypothetical protein
VLVEVIGKLGLDEGVGCWGSSMNWGNLLLSLDECTLLWFSMLVMMLLSTSSMMVLLVSVGGLLLGMGLFGNHILYLGLDHVLDLTFS